MNKGVGYCLWTGQDSFSHFSIGGADSIPKEQDLFVYIQKLFVKTLLPT